MKIVQLADYYNERTGNPISIFTRSIKERGHNVQVVTSDQQHNPACEADSQSSVRVYRFRGLKVGNKSFFPGAIPFLLRQSEKTIIHAHVLGFFSTFIAGYLKTVKKYKLVLTPDYDVKGKKQSFFKRLFDYFFFVLPARNADIVIPFTQIEKETINQRFGIKQEKMRTLPIGIEWKKFQKKETKLKKKLGLEKKFVLISVCYLSRKKNLEMSIKALNHLGEEAVLIHVGGISDTEYKKELDQLICQLGLTKRVIFVGKRDLEDIIKYYAISDVFLNTGFNESFAIPIIEAMAAGLPVLTTEVGIAPEAIVQGKHGFFIESEKQVAEKLKWLINHPQERKNISHENRQRAKDFDWTRIINQLEKIYLTLI
jgi:glycosyltransferase involved in cell wall biosynthesis